MERPPCLVSSLLQSNRMKGVAREAIEEEIKD